MKDRVAAIAMPRGLLLFFAFGLLLTLALFAMVFVPSSRGTGGMGGIGDAFFYLMGAYAVGGLLAWTFISWLAYRLMAALTKAWRLGLTALLWISPGLFLVGGLAFDPRAGEANPAARDFYAAEPQSFLGVSFPAGSRLEFADNGRTLVGAWSVFPLEFEGLRVRGLRLESAHDRAKLYLELSQPQPIEGWLCGVQTPVAVRRQGSHLELIQCTLQEHVQAGVRWPTGTQVRRAAEAWRVDAATGIGMKPRETCDDPILIDSVRYVTVKAELDAQRQTLRIKSATPCAVAAQPR